MNIIEEKKTLVTHNNELCEENIGNYDCLFPLSNGESDEEAIDFPSHYQ